MGDYRRNDDGIPFSSKAFFFGKVFHISDQGIPNLPCRRLIGIL